MNRPIHRWLGAVLAAGALWLPAAAVLAAQGYPAAPVTMIIPGPAGSGTDLIGRLLADDLSRRWQQPVVVENRAGASGMLGTQMLMRAKPDGYTLLLGHVSTHSIVPALHRPAPYDPVADFEAIGLIGTTSNVLVVAADSGIKTLDDLLSKGRREGTLAYGSPGVGLSQHFDGFVLGKEAGLDMLHVPYKGSGPALTDLIGGRIAMAFVTPPAAISAIQSGKLLALGQTSAQRQQALADVPTFKERGMDELVNVSWWGLFAPEGTPPEVIAAVNRGMGLALAEAKVRKGLLDMVIEPARPAGPEDFAALVEQDYARWTRLVQESGIRVD